MAARSPASSNRKRADGDGPEPAHGRSERLDGSMHNKNGLPLQRGDEVLPPRLAAPEPAGERAAILSSIYIYARRRRPPGRPGASDVAQEPRRAGVHEALRHRQILLDPARGGGGGDLLGIRLPVDVASRRHGTYHLALCVVLTLDECSCDPLVINM